MRAPASPWRQTRTKATRCPSRRCSIPPHPSSRATYSVTLRPLLPHNPLTLLLETCLTAPVVAAARLQLLVGGPRPGRPRPHTATWGVPVQKEHAPAQQLHHRCEGRGSHLQFAPQARSLLCRCSPSLHDEHRSHGFRHAAREQPGAVARRHA